MNPPVIIDAGPSLNFFAANQERLLIGVVGPLAMPRTVHDEIANKTARDERFSAAAGVLRKIRGTQFLAILEDDHTSALDNVVHRLTGAPLEERRSLPKDLGEIMVIAHAVVMAESGADVRVVIDDGYGARQAGISTLIIPWENKKDLPEDHLGLTIHRLKTAEEAFDLLFADEKWKQRPEPPADSMQR